MKKEKNLWRYFFEFPGNCRHPMFENLTIQTLLSMHEKSLRKYFFFQLEAPKQSEKKTKTQKTYISKRLSQINIIDPR